MSLKILLKYLYIEGFISDKVGIDINKIKGAVEL